MSDPGTPPGAAGSAGSGEPDEPADLTVNTSTTPLLTRRAGLPSRGRGGRPLLGSTLLTHLVLALVGVAVLYVLTDQASDIANVNLGTIGMYVCVAGGLTILTGLNGQVSLGHAGLMGIGAYTVALLQGHWSSSNTTGLWVLPSSLIAGVVVTAVAGLAVGAAAARLRGPYLAGATLSLGIALPAFTVHFADTFKGDQGLSVALDPTPEQLGASFSSSHWQAWITLSAALLALVLLANLARSKTGRDMRAVRDDEVAAQLAGLSVARVQVLAFVVSSAAAGLAGGLFAVLLQTATPGAFGLALSLSLLSAIVIGGLGSLTGAVIGSVVLVYLPLKVNDFTDQLGLSGTTAQHVHDNLPNAVYGLLLILIMVAAPGGIQGSVRRLVGLVPRRR